VDRIFCQSQNCKLDLKNKNCEEKQQEEKDVKENNLHADLSSTLHEVV
jgi:hypothetical protein